MTFPEKLKMLRKSVSQTQAEFANAVGISRANLANMELGNVKPTQVLLNCVSLMYNVDRHWLTDDSSDDLSQLNKPTNTVNQIVEKYERLDDDYKKFVENQIVQLLNLQQGKLQGGE